MDYFFCYDGKLMRKLQERGIRYITRALTIKEYKKFWLYAITPELQTVLLELKDTE